MSENTTEVIVGGGVLAAAVGFFFYAGSLSGFAAPASEEFTLNASFRSVEGITVGTDVRLAGVKIGTVTDMALNPTSFRADLDLAVSSAIELPDDSAVVISSEGLLGGNFVEILPGGSPFNLADGDTIEDTQGAVSLISLLLKFVSGGEE